MMLTNAILHKNGEKRPPVFKDIRSILKMLIEVRKSMGSLGMGLGYKP
jgi:hypothetical protein